jgi:AcrR family transcriptional regulator
VNQNATRGQATREHIVDVATDLFATAGFDGTSIDTVMRTAGVSKGALYHHFPGKEALFEAVLDRVTERVELALAEAADGVQSPADLLRIGCAVWIRQAVDPVVQQIMLIDAPAVLGWQRWRERDEANTLGAVRTALTVAASQGILDLRHVDVFAHALLAMVNELALMIARADDPAHALVEAESALHELFDRILRPDPAN